MIQLLLKGQNSFVSPIGVEVVVDNTIAHSCPNMQFQ